jgi:uncharacterized OB-fold protein
MSPAPLRHPTLYTEGGTPAFPGAPALRGIRCRCGHPAFPPQHYGCEVCGRHGDALADVLLAGHGRLLASATVHRHGAPHPKVPFTVVEVLLDDGCTVRALAASEVAGELAAGTEMLAVLEPVKIDDQPMRELRFRPAGAP